MSHWAEQGLEQSLSVHLLWTRRLGRKDKVERLVRSQRNDAILQNCFVIGMMFCKIEMRLFWITLCLARFDRSRKSPFSIDEFAMFSFSWIILASSQSMEWTSILLPTVLIHQHRHSRWMTCRRKSRLTIQFGSPWSYSMCLYAGSAIIRLASSSAWDFLSYRCWLFVNNSRNLFRSSIQFINAFIDQSMSHCCLFLLVPTTRKI